MNEECKLPVELEKIFCSIASDFENAIVEKCNVFIAEIGYDLKLNNKEFVEMLNDYLKKHNLLNNCWVPQDGDAVYIINSAGEVVEDCFDSGYCRDIAMLKAGFMFPTEEEAVVNRARIYKEYLEFQKNDHDKR